MHRWLDEHAADDCCDIVTIGRRTGKPHEIEMWFGVIPASRTRSRCGSV
jgi:hypothetical protein